MFAFLKRLVLFGGFLLLGLEVVFRTVIPAAEMPAGFQDPQYEIMHLDRNAPADGHNSMGRLGRPRFAWHVNNFGFNSIIDYRTPGEREMPCVVVIGNSYTQGLYSDADDHLAGQLQATLGPAAEVYNLGTSGMPLSQCPRVVKYAKDHFAPDLIVIQAGSGSVERCLRRFGKVPYCQQYRWRDGGLEALPPSKFTVNRRNRLLRRSALVRYLFYNSNFDLGGQGNVEQARQAPEADGPGGAAEETVALLETAVHQVLTEIRDLVPHTPILIVFDADRAALYETGTTPDRLRNSPLLERICGEYGIRFLDLTVAFAQEYRVRGLKFNFDDNYHWNPYGVGVVTSSIVEKLEMEKLFREGRLVGFSAAAE